MSEIIKIGILGGSFDPPHEAHLSMARFSMENIDLDRILFIPCYQNPLKDISGYASPFHRYVMTQLATLVENRIMVTPMEIIRGGSSYTIDTLKSLERTGFRLNLIMGLDAYLSITEWKDSIQYPDYLDKIIVFTREMQENQFTEFPEELLNISEFVGGFDSQISSTEIRNNIRNNDKINHLVSPMVRVYIEKYELYRDLRDQNRLIEDTIKYGFS